MKKVNKEDIEEYFNKFFKDVGELGENVIGLDVEEKLDFVKGYLTEKINDIDASVREYTKLDVVDELKKYMKKKFDKNE